MKRITFTTVVSILSFIGLVCCAPKLAPEALEAESKAIHDRVLTVDTHCDTTYRLLSDDWDIGERHNPNERRSGKIDLPRMAEGGLDAEFFAVFVGQGERTPEGYAKAQERALQQLEGVHRMCEKYPHLVGLATSPDDAYRLEKEGKRAAYIGMENGYPIGRDLSLVEEYYKKGVRYITLCHGGDNDICDSSTERNNPEDNGLSDFGKEVVAECNRLGIMIDISHASDKTFYDVLDASKAPIIASHSSVRTLCDHPRNLTDEMIKALAADGGVIQICFVSSFVKTPKPNPERDKALQALREKYGPRREIKDEKVLEKMREEYMAVYEQYPMDRATVEDLVDHIDHVVKLVGVDHVGIGTDFDGGGDLEGCSDVSELPNITAELVRRGYSEAEIRMIWGENLMRVFRAVIEAAKQMQN